MRPYKLISEKVFEPVVERIKTTAGASSNQLYSTGVIAATLGYSRQYFYKHGKEKAAQHT